MMGGLCPCRYTIPHRICQAQRLSTSASMCLWRLRYLCPLAAQSSVLLSRAASRAEDALAQRARGEQLRDEVDGVALRVHPGVVERQDILVLELHLQETVRGCRRQAEAAERAGALLRLTCFSILISAYRRSRSSLLVTSSLMRTCAPACSSAVDSRPAAPSRCTAHLGPGDFHSFLFVKAPVHRLEGAPPQHGVRLQPRQSTQLAAQASDCCRSKQTRSASQAGESGA